MLLRCQVALTDVLTWLNRHAIHLSATTQGNRDRDRCTEHSVVMCYVALQT
ncbi:MAG: hypothetical protein AAFX01_05785 [Cyanobacteria bacterium J06638_28]